MKRIVALVVMLVLITVGCTEKIPSEKPRQEEDIGYVKGVWFSYSEINAMLQNGGLKESFPAALKRLSNYEITDVFIHLRAFGDSLFHSKLFPLNAAAAEYDFDVFEFMVECCKKENIRVHAWINPYRLSLSSTSLSALPQSGRVYEWLSDQDPLNDRNVVALDGIYLNPASIEVRGLIVEGIREVVLGYDIDGIHFDDYFYPTSSPEFDKNFYDEYQDSFAAALSLDEYRRENVNALISSCYTAIKFINKDIVFSISPAAGIEKNFNELYADVSQWISAPSVDWIIPQLYFGFEYPDSRYRFENLLEEWEILVKGKDVRLIIGLAAYKVGKTSPPDNEWGERDNVLARQIALCEADKAVSGHVFFSYSSLIASA